MALATVHSRALSGVEAPPVDAEVHLGGGLPSMAIVGLPETAVRESKERVRAALQNAGFDFPRRRITINLTPADLPKEGGRYDLPIAIGILAASQQIPADALAHHELLGELTLAGQLRPVRGALPAAVGAAARGRSLVLPGPNAPEAALGNAGATRGAAHLLDVCRYLCGEDALAVEPPPSAAAADTTVPDLADVRGQQHARRALEIAAAGGHTLLFIGPPGTGKSMLAARLPGILPPMTQQEALEAAAIASICDGGFDVDKWGRRPFRAPHHTASGVALVGGGGHPRPGEISLAHRGVLFLDELAEFSRHVLDVLREPLESGRITISRAARQAEFPARFQLVAAMNPCPCGQLGDPRAVCRCSTEQIQRYRARLSGPLLDRIDLHVEVPRLPQAALGSAAGQGEASAAVQSRVIAARERALVRSGCANAGLGAGELERDAAISGDALAALEHSVERLGLSARAYHRILRVARTIADLAGSTAVGPEHVAEAVACRSLDRPTGTCA